jgi:competence ComEA-like helix-hairpin-helix protein
VIGADASRPRTTDEARLRTVAALLSAHAQQESRPGLLDRIRASRFARPLARTAGVVVALVVLAAIGLWADPRPTPSPPGASSSAALVVPAIPVAEPSGSATPLPAPSAQAPEPPKPTGILPDGRVVLNVATADELSKLPHVGEKRAKEILALRDRLGGRFRAVTDLLRVKGLGRKTLAKIAPKCVLDPPKDPSPPA